MDISHPLLDNELAKRDMTLSLPPEINVEVTKKTFIFRKYGQI